MPNHSKQTNQSDISSAFVLKNLCTIPSQIGTYVINNPLKSLVIYLAGFSLVPAEAWKPPKIKIPSIPGIKKYHYCVVEQPEVYGEIPKHKDCTSYVGGEAGRVSCALFKGEKGTVYYGECSDSENQKRLGYGQDL